MKLCIVTHTVSKGDGQGRVNYEVVKEAICRGHDVTILASQLALELQQNPKVEWIPISVKRWPTAFVRNLIFSGKSANWLRRIRSTIDIVKVNGAIINARADVNAVHFVHSSWLRSPVHTSRLRKDIYGLYQWLYTALSARWEQKAFQQATIIIAVSEKVKQELVDIGISTERIQVIVNGVDLQEFSPGTAKRSQIGLSEGVTLALFVGDIQTPRKNLDTILNALIQVPDLHLAVTGAMEGSPYPQMVTKLGLNTRVHFLGYRNDVPEIMRAVDFFVFPSRYEACTLVLLEAMASGLPVISATSAGGSELITPDCGIVLQNSEDISALAKALKLLTKHPEQRENMGKASRALAEQHSWTIMAQKYVDLFEQLGSGDGNFRNKMFLNT